MQQQQQQQQQSSASTNGMSHSGGGAGGQAHHHQSLTGSSESGSLTALAQPYAAEASNFGPTTLYHHHLNLHNHHHHQLNGFSANAAAGHYNLHHSHLHHPYNKAISSTSPEAGVGVQNVTTTGSAGGSSASRSPSDVESGMSAEYLSSYHPHHHQGFYSSLHHHNMNISGHHHPHPYQHMVRSNGTYIDFIPR